MKNRREPGEQSADNARCAPANSSTRRSASARLRFDVRQQHRAQDVAAPLRERRGRRRRPSSRQQQTLDEQLADEPPAADAERDAHRDLAATLKRASEQQVADVRARDQQHDRRDADQPRGDLGVV